MFIAGWNLAGCVSDPDSNYVTDNWNDAVTYLREIIESWWDADYAIAEWEEENDLSSEAKQEVDNRYLNAHTLLHNSPPPPDFFALTQDYAGNNWEMWIVEAEGDIDE